MSDWFCFTCSHEIRQDLDGIWQHDDESDDVACPCRADEIPCEPW